MGLSQLYERLGTHRECQLDITTLDNFTPKWSSPMYLYGNNHMAGKGDNHLHFMMTTNHAVVQLTNSVLATICLIHCISLV